MKKGVHVNATITRLVTFIGRSSVVEERAAAATEVRTITISWNVCSECLVVVDFF